jgi:hypothetical protein
VGRRGACGVDEEGEELDLVRVRIGVRVRVRG